MKNIFRRFILGLILIISLSGCEKEMANVNYKVVDECSNKPELLLNDNGINIYTYCLNEMSVYIGDSKVNLDEYIVNNDNWLDNIISKLDNVDMLYDGGTKIYKGNNEVRIRGKP